MATQQNSKHAEEQLKTFKELNLNEPVSLSFCVLTTYEHLNPGESVLN